MVLWIAFFQKDFFYIIMLFIFECIICKPSHWVSNNSKHGIVQNKSLYGMSSFYSSPLWWSWEYVVYIIIIKSAVWSINHCLGLCNEAMVYTVCLIIFIWRRLNCRIVSVTIIFCQNAYLIFTQHLKNVIIYGRVLQNIFHYIMIDFILAGYR